MDYGKLGSQTIKIYLYSSFNQILPLKEREKLSNVTQSLTVRFYQTVHKFDSLKGQYKGTSCSYSKMILISNFGATK